MKIKYYVKKTYYADRVNVVFLPNELITKQKNINGIKNLGKNRFKLRNSLVRSRTNFIRKALHNFVYAEHLYFITLTFRENITDLVKANNHYKVFMKYLTYHYPYLKSVVVAENQKRGAWHFHLLVDKRIDADLIHAWWNYKYGLGSQILIKPCRKDRYGGHHGFVIRYMAKYFTKSFYDEKSLIQTQLNFKTYRFSKNCIEPVDEVENVEWEYLDMFSNCLVSSDFSKPFYGSDKKVIGYICDYSLENWENKIMKGKVLN